MVACISFVTMRCRAAGCPNSVASGFYFNSLPPLKFIEEQLSSAFRQTPLETDCTVSVSALRSIGLETEQQQLAWLISKRPEANGKNWRLNDIHWDFSEGAARPALAVISAPLATGMPAARTVIRRIVVDPVIPLKNGAGRKRSEGV